MGDKGGGGEFPGICKGLNTHLTDEIARATTVENAINQNLSNRLKYKKVEITNSYSISLDFSDLPTNNGFGLLWYCIGYSWSSGEPINFGLGTFRRDAAKDGSAKAFVSSGLSSVSETSTTLTVTATAHTSYLTLIVVYY